MGIIRPCGSTEAALYQGAATHQYTVIGHNVLAGPIHPYALVCPAQHGAEQRSPKSRINGAAACKDKKIRPPATTQSGSSGVVHWMSGIEDLQSCYSREVRAARKFPSVPSAEGQVVLVPTAQTLRVPRQRLGLIRGMLWIREPVPEHHLNFRRLTWPTRRRDPPVKGWCLACRESACARRINAGSELPKSNRKPSRRTTAGGYSRRLLCSD